AGQADGVDGWSARYGHAYPLRGGFSRDPEVFPFSSPSGRGAARPLFALPNQTRPMNTISSRYTMIAPASRGMSDTISRHPTCDSAASTFPSLQRGVRRISPVEGLDAMRNCRQERRGGAFGE